MNPANVDGRQPATIFDLPVEILQHVASFFKPREALSYSSILALRWTCSHFHSAIPPLEAGKPALVPDLLNIEMWPTYTEPIKLAYILGKKVEQLLPNLPDDQTSSNSAIEFVECDRRYASKIPAQDSYACFTCETLKRSCDFTTSQIGNKRSKMHPERATSSGLVTDDSVNSMHDANERLLKRRVSEIQKRFCIRCGMRLKIYPPGGTILRYLEPELVELRRETKRVMGRDEPCPASTVLAAQSGTCFVCRRCGQFAKAILDSKECLKRKCSKCLDYRPPGASQPWSGNRPRRHSSLEALHNASSHMRTDPEENT